MSEHDYNSDSIHSDQTIWMTLEEPVIISNITSHVDVIPALRILRRLLEVVNDSTIRVSNQNK